MRDVVIMLLPLLGQSHAKGLAMKDTSGEHAFVDNVAFMLADKLIGELSSDLHVDLLNTALAPAGNAIGGPRLHTGPIRPFGGNTHALRPANPPLIAHARSSLQAGQRASIRSAATSAAKSESIMDTVGTMPITTAILVAACYVLPVGTVTQTLVALGLGTAWIKTLFVKEEGLEVQFAKHVKSLGGATKLKDMAPGDRLVRPGRLAGLKVWFAGMSENQKKFAGIVLVIGLILAWMVLGSQMGWISVGSGAAAGA